MGLRYYGGGLVVFEVGKSGGVYRHKALRACEVGRGFGHYAVDC